MSKICVTCSSELCSYKCPSCFNHFCSSTCYKTHKSTCQQHKVLNPKSTPETTKQEYITEDTVSTDKLHLLSQDETIRNLLQNPHLRNLLIEIDNATEASVVMHKAMLEPIFVELADACLKIVDHQETSSDSMTYSEYIKKL